MFFLESVNFVPNHVVIYQEKCNCIWFIVSFYKKIGSDVSSKLHLVYSVNL